MKFKFNGIIDCNTEVILDDITQEQYLGIQKFINALDNAQCSYVSCSNKLIGQSDEEMKYYKDKIIQELNIADDKIELLDDMVNKSSYTYKSLYLLISWLDNKLHK